MELNNTLQNVVMSLFMYQKMILSSFSWLSSIVLCNTRLLPCVNAWSGSSTSSCQNRQVFSKNQADHDWQKAWSTLMSGWIKGERFSIETLTQTTLTLSSCPIFESMSHGPCLNGHQRSTMLFRSQMSNAVLFFSEPPPSPETACSKVFATMAISLR